MRIAHDKKRHSPIAAKQLQEVRQDGLEVIPPVIHEQVHNKSL
jgi:hypothetical protein